MEDKLRKNNLQQRITEVWDNRELLSDKNYQDAIREVVDLLDNGLIRVAEPNGESWQVNEWVKKAVLMYFPIQKMRTIEVGALEFYDKIPLKKNYESQGVR